MLKGRNRSAVCEASRSDELIRVAGSRAWEWGEASLDPSAAHATLLGVYRFIFVILATKRRLRAHSVRRHPDWTLGVDWRDFARLSSAARAKRGETNGADPPRTTFARPRHQHRRDAAHTTHPNHGPKCEKLPGRVRETSTNRNARAVRGAPRLAAGHSSIATTGARDAHELLTARRPDSSAFRRTRAHDVAAKGRTRPNVRRL